MKQYDAAAGFFDFLQNGFQTIFKFATILGSGNHGAEIRATMRSV